MQITKYYKNKELDLLGVTYDTEQKTFEIWQFGVDSSIRNKNQLLNLLRSWFLFFLAHYFSLILSNAMS